MSYNSITDYLEWEAWEPTEFNTWVPTHKFDNLSGDEIWEMYQREVQA